MLRLYPSAVHGSIKSSMLAFIQLRVSVRSDLCTLDFHALLDLVENGCLRKVLEFLFEPDCISHSIFMLVLSNE
jgi:hypothetical protein